MPVIAEENLSVVSFALRVGPDEFQMQMRVPAEPVKPLRMLPVIHKIANAFVELSEQRSLESGKAISCKAGCGACCRQPVPLAEVEIYQIAELVDTLPEPRQSEVRAKFKAGNDHFSSIGWYDRMKTIASHSSDKAPEALMGQIKQAVSEYFREGVACPFLEDESCSIHELRPLACREYLVTSPAEFCANPGDERTERVDIVKKISKPLQTFGSTGKIDRLGFFPMIRALTIAEEYPESFASRNGAAWMKRLLAVPADESSCAPESTRQARKRAPRRPRKRH
jgi:Fe-S-cluster containining protein